MLTGPDEPSITASREAPTEDVNADTHPIAVYSAQDDVMMRYMVGQQSIVGYKFAYHGKYKTFYPTGIRNNDNEGGPYLIGTTSDDPRKPRPAKIMLNSICGHVLELLRWPTNRQGKPVGLPAGVKVGKAITSKDLADDIKNNLPEGSDTLFVARVPVALPLAGKHTAKKSGSVDSDAVSKPIEEYHPIAAVFAKIAKYQSTNKRSVFDPTVESAVSGISEDCIPGIDTARYVVNTYDSSKIEDLDEDDEKDAADHKLVVEASAKLIRASFMDWVMEQQPQRSSKRDRDEDSIINMSVGGNKRQCDAASVSGETAALSNDVANITIAWQVLGAKLIAPKEGTGEHTIELGEISSTLRDAIKTGDNSSTLASNMNELQKKKSVQASKSENFLFRNTNEHSFNEYGWKMILKNKHNNGNIPNDIRSPEYKGEAKQLASALVWCPQTYTEREEIKTEINQRQADIHVEAAKEHRTAAKREFSIRGALAVGRYSILELVNNLCVRDMIFNEMEPDEPSGWSVRVQMYYDLAKLITSHEFKSWYDDLKGSRPYVWDKILVIIYKIDQAFSKIANDPTIRYKAMSGADLDPHIFDAPMAIFDDFQKGLRTCFSNGDGSGIFAEAPGFSKYANGATAKSNRQLQEEKKKDQQVMANLQKQINEMKQKAEWMNRQPPPQQQQYPPRYDDRNGFPPRPPPGTGPNPNMDGLIRTTAFPINLPRLSVKVCRDYITKGRTCGYGGRCNFKHIANVNSDLDSNDQKILIDHVEQDTTLSWSGRAPTRPEGPPQQIRN